jgi:hypothetical protein
MDRRSLLKFGALLGISRTASTAEASAAPSSPSSKKGPIVLFCDLAVDPAREQEMLEHFHKDFKPAAEKFDGYMDLKMLRLRKVIQGGPPPASNINYRFQLTYQSEEKRQIWIASEVHKQNWPLIEDTVIDKGYLTLLTDNV